MLSEEQTAEDADHAREHETEHEVDEARHQIRHDLGAEEQVAERRKIFESGGKKKAPLPEEAIHHHASRITRQDQRAVRNWRVFRIIAAAALPFQKMTRFSAYSRRRLKISPTMPVMMTYA